MTLRLTESASCLVSDEGDMSGYLQRLLKQAGQKAPDAQPILELNPEHALVRKLRDLQGEESGDAFSDRLQVLFDQALLAEGGMLEDPAAYVQRVNKLLA
ncbi:Chaperone protein HtpG [compost metagenome]